MGFVIQMMFVLQGVCEIQDYLCGMNYTQGNVPCRMCLLQQFFFVPVEHHGDDCAVTKLW